MSLLLSSSHHHFSFFSKPPFHHHNHHHHHHHHLLSLHNPPKKPPIQKTLINSNQPNSITNQNPLPKSAIQRIAEKLQSLGFKQDPIQNTHFTDSQNSSKNGTFRVWNPVSDPGSGVEDPIQNTHFSDSQNSSNFGEIYIPNRKEIPNFRVGHTLDTSWSSPHNPVSDPGSGVEDQIQNTHFPDSRNSSKFGTFRVPQNPVSDLGLGEKDPIQKTHFRDIQNSSKIGAFGVGHTLDTSWSTPINPVPEPGSGEAIVKLNGLSRVAISERKEEREGMEKVPTLAELTLSSSEIRRLTTLGIRMKQKMKLGKAGITEGVVNGIHERWRSFEVVKIVCEDICRLNMKRTHDLLERKTGGMVVWRTGSKIVLYRGVNYKYPYFSRDELSSNSISEISEEMDDGMQFREQKHSSDMLVKYSGQSSAKNMDQSSLVPGVGSPSRVRFLTPGESELVEEADRLLDGLGPRFTDWWGCEPLPIDADLLPAVVRGYRRPFRLLPYGVKPQLTNDEMTTLKRLGRPLPCHFALGRNRKLQGLASAILKLWEKCEIAKIAVKRGVQNTNSELMAEELKSLTGGILLSRDKEYMVFYRGKDFLPSAVSSAIEERRRNRALKNDVLASDSLTKTDENIVLGTEVHTSSSVNKTRNDQRMRNASQERDIASIQRTIAITTKKLAMAEEEKARTQKLLSDLEQAETSRQVEVDKEGITEEEKYMLRKVGLRMKPFLLMGRRGVFDGTIENMHLHWKYRELVKIICGGRDIAEIHKTARILEAESGGILVAVERVRKGHAIIVYRGKNYQRPPSLRPETLLNKKEALKRSIEAQRHESLKLNVLKLTKNIDKLNLKLVEDREALDKSTKQEKSPLASGSEEIRDASNDSGYASCNESESSFTSGLGDNFEHHIINDESIEPSQEFVNEDANSQSLNEALEKNSHSMPPRALTNKERLLLRQLALKMKRRPVLAVGKSNVVTGIAKAIKDHFKKYPLAIVNVKGRAKGTSVQEVIFKLVQETGGLLVSQEPSKIILYRGWGAGIETGRGFSKDYDKKATVPSLVVSPELLAAMRVECGLESGIDQG